jgi:hypothetical protein
VTFAAGHPACVGFVVVAGQVKQAMEHQNFDFDCNGVALLGGLAEGRGHADGEVARDFLLPLDQRFGGEREDVGGLVEAAELAVQASDGFVRCEEDGDVAMESNGVPRLTKKTSEGAGRGNESNL